MIDHQLGPVRAGRKLSAQESMTNEAFSQVREYLTAVGCDMIDVEKRFVTCPGKQRHTTPNADSDCKLYNNGRGFFQMHCQHTSCRHRIELANNVLALYAKQGRTRGSATSIVGTDAQIEQPKVETEIDTELYEAIQAEYAWNLPQIKADSDDCINEPDDQHHLLLLSLFDDDDNVWIGRDPFDTGSVKHKYRFRPVLEWLSYSNAPGVFICPSTFKPGSYSRCAANVVARKFLVVESDELGRNDIGGVFQWLDQALRVRLRAIVDTTGRSLHGWFDYPQSSVAAQLKKWLPRLQCDAAMFNPAQPCRLPGALRERVDGPAYQKLVYIRKEGDHDEIEAS